MKFGIIGYGSFGKLLANVLSEFGEVIVYDRDKTEKTPSASLAFGSFEEAVSAKVVILAVGLESLDDISKKAADYVTDETIVVDVCSAKIKSIEILTKNLDGKCRVLATHPLFGPHSAKDNLIAGKSIVVCDYDLAGKDKVMDFLQNKLKLKVIEMSAEEHDREMAWVHALTFFVGRGLMKLSPPKSSLTTGYYQKLLDLVELESSHSIELFNTVQRGNPFAAEIRRKLITELENIDKEIGES